MEIEEILKLNIKQINSVPLTNIVESVYIGDLLSFVMVNGSKTYQCNCCCSVK